MDILSTPLELESISVGEPTNCDLFDAMGNFLLAKGECVTENIYKLLLKRQVFRFFQEETGNVRAKRFSSKIYRKVLDSVRHLYYETALVDSAQLGKTIELVDLMVSELESSPKTFIDLNELRTYDDNLYVHSINVAILSGIIGRELGYSGLQVRELVLGAVLHDVGKLLVPKNILNKDSGLTISEFAIIKRHPEKGVEMLANVQVSTAVLNIVRHHHERWDGSGYPYGLKGDKNSLYSQIVAVADIFDAITADRPYRRGLPFYHSYELMINNQGLNPTVLNAFKQCIVFYPENSLVTLNTGEVGQVIEIPLNYPTRPSIRILYDADGTEVVENQTVSLMEDLTRFIKEVRFESK